MAPPALKNMPYAIVPATAMLVDGSAAASAAGSTVVSTPGSV